MKDLHSTKEMYEFSPVCQKIYDRVCKRVRPNREREGTWTNMHLDGKTPFLDTFDSNPDEAYVTVLAKAIVASWLETEPEIDEGDLIVGVTRPRRLCNEHFSYGIHINDWMLDEEPYKDRADELREKLERNRSRLVPLDGRRAIDPKAKELVGDFGPYDEFMWVGGYQGHTVPSYPLLLENGIDKTKEKIAKYRQLYKDDQEKQELYDAFNIILDGFTAYAELYATTAEKKIELTDDEAEKGNLRRIAATCRTIAHKAPETLGEAAQLMWFYSLWDWVDCVGRVDQYFYPFYEKCVKEEGRSVAQDYMCAVWFRVFENGSHNVTIGGQKPDGTDATNELTYLLLQICRRCHQTHPRLTVRFHRNSPRDLMDIIVKMWSEGMSDPTVTSDENAVKGLCAYGVPIEDARDYTMLGCQEIEIPGKSNFGCEDGSLNLAAVFDFTFNNGCDRKGNKVGLETGYYSDYDNIEDMWLAFEKQIRRITPIWAEITNCGVDIRVANKAKLVKSVFTANCIERGLDMDNGGAIYNYGVMETCGSAAVGDCFTAIQRVVFEQKKMTMETLRKAIDANFEGYEKERQLLLHAPKFGNDDSLSDWWTKRVLDCFWGEIGKCRSRRGGVFTGACSLLEGGIGYGAATWALPDGRFKGEPLSNTIGPREGNDRSGVTAMLKSVAKLPLDKGVGGTTLNVVLPRSLMQTEDLRSDIAEAMFTYLMTGGQMAQITTADLDDMKDAQVNPDKHRDLIVRIGGFSIEFVQLGKYAQDEIISRYGENY